MALFDILLIALVVLSGIKGFQRGFIVEVFSLVALIIGLYVALEFTFPVAMNLLGDLENFWVLALVIFVLLFILVIWLVMLVAKGIKKVIDFTLVGVLDNLLGAMLSVVKWVFALSVLLWVGTSLNMELPRQWVAHSGMYELVAGLAPGLTDYVGNILPFLKEIYEKMNDLPV